MIEPIRAGQLFPHIAPPGQLGRKSTPVAQGQLPTGQKSFQNILDGTMVKFSNHAEVRLQQRGIRFGVEQLNKLETAIDKAAAKGSKESLILIQDVALIVNIKNRTVVTAIEGNQMKDNVFTQIDSAVIIS
ncbi:MAG: TIGR02530 family flagellar biosynthesis protein [Paenibacillaceae bacterium]